MGLVLAVVALVILLSVLLTARAHHAQEQERIQKRIERSQLCEALAPNQYKYDVCMGNVP